MIITILRIIAGGALAMYFLGTAIVAVFGDKDEEDKHDQIDCK